MTQEGVKIQQRDQNSTAKDGPHSTKNPLKNLPRVGIQLEVKILSYTGLPFQEYCVQRKSFSSHILVE